MPREPEGLKGIKVKEHNGSDSVLHPNENQPYKAQ